MLLSDEEKIGTGGIARQIVGRRAFKERICLGELVASPTDPQVLVKPLLPSREVRRPKRCQVVIQGTSESTRRVLHR